jgi:hypothetical protein
LLPVRNILHFLRPEANPKIVSYNSRAVKIYNATSSLVRFGEKHCFCIYKTLQPTTYNGGVVVVSLNQELQCQRCKYFTTPRVAKRVLKTKIFYSTLKNALIYVLLRWRCGCEVVVLAPSHTAYRLIYTYNDNGFARKKRWKNS